MFARDRLNDLSHCAFDFLEHYLQIVSDAVPVENASRLQTIERFHDRFIEDIRTQDKAQGMIAKMIGKEKARRIFYEITT
jgi:hypothetical protein